MQRFSGRFPLRTVCLCTVSHKLSPQIFAPSHTARFFLIFSRLTKYSSYSRNISLLLTLATAGRYGHFLISDGSRRDKCDRLTLLPESKFCGSTPKIRYQCPLVWGRFYVPYQNRFHRRRPKIGYALRIRHANSKSPLSQKYCTVQMMP